MSRVTTSLLGLLAATNGQFSVWEVEPSLPSARSDMTATATSDGLIYIVGGCVGDQEVYCPEITASCTIFDPSSETFSSCADAPRERYRHAAVALDDSEIYLFGGRTLDDTLINEIDVYDIESNTWSTLSTEWSSATSDLASFVVESSESSDDLLIYLIGGYIQNYTTLACMDVLSVSTASETTSYTWLESSDYECMQEARGDFGVVVIGDFAYAMGGFTDANGFCPALTTMERYDIGGNRWTSVASFDQGRGDKAVGVLDEEIFVFGGEDKLYCNTSTQETVPLSDVEIYSPDEDTWTQDAVDIPEERFRFAAATSGDSIYIFGGQKFYSDACSCYAVADDVLRYSLTVDASPRTQFSIVATVLVFVVCLANHF